MASVFDPLGLVGLAVRVASWSERQFYGLLRSRMDETLPPELAELPTSRSAAEGLDTKMHRLLDRAVEQSTAASRNELFHMIVDQLVPDEARIIGALSDGSASPLVHVYARTRAGLVGGWSWRTCR